MLGQRKTLTIPFTLNFLCGIHGGRQGWLIQFCFRCKHNFHSAMAERLSRHRSFYGCFNVKNNFDNYCCFRINKLWPVLRGPCIVSNLIIDPNLCRTAYVCWWKHPQSQQFGAANAIGQERWNQLESWLIMRNDTRPQKKGRLRSTSVNQ